MGLQWQCMKKRGPKVGDKTRAELEMPEPGAADEENFIGIEGNNASADKSEADEREFEDAFFPKPPPARRKIDLAKMKVAKRQRRFLQSYNAYCGNVTRAIFDSGSDRLELKRWMSEPEFSSAITEIKCQIQDRVKYVLFERCGLIKSRPFQPRVSENLLLKAAMGLNKEIWGDDNEGQVHLHINIPRPDVRQDGGGGLPPDGQAGQLSHEPG